MPRPKCSSTALLMLLLAETCLQMLRTTLLFSLIVGVAAGAIRRETLCVTKGLVFFALTAAASARMTISMQVFFFFCDC